MEIPCRFFVKGYCKFGDGCRFAHIIPRKIDYQYTGYNRKFNDSDLNNYSKPEIYNSKFKPHQGNIYDVFNDENVMTANQFDYKSDNSSKYHKNNYFPNKNNDRYHYFKSNESKANLKTPSLEELTSEEQLLLLQSDMLEWKESKMWLLSCYAIFGSKKSIPGLEDYSFEEIRFANTSNSCINEINSIFQQQLKKIDSLLNPDINDTINLKQLLKESQESQVDSIFKSERASNKFDDRQPNIFSNNFASSNIFTSTVLPERISNEFPSNMNTLTKHSEADPIHLHAFNSSSLSQLHQNNFSIQNTSQPNSTITGLNNNAAYSTMQILTQNEIDQYQSSDFLLVPFNPPTIDMI